MNAHESNGATNWEEIRSRLNEAAAALNHDGIDTRDEERILRERARAISVPTVAGEAAEVCRLVLFETRGQLFAVDSEFATEAFPVSTCTRIPNTPSYVIGVIGLRGEVVSLVSLPVLLGLGTAQPEIEPLALRLVNARMEIALSVISVSSVESIPLNNIRKPPDGLAPDIAACVRGVLPGGHTYLDGNELLSPERLGEGKKTAREFI